MEDRKAAPRGFTEADWGGSWCSEETEFSLQALLANGRRDGRHLGLAPEKHLDFFRVKCSLLLSLGELGHIKDLKGIPALEDSWFFNARLY